MVATPSLIPGLYAGLVMKNLVTKVAEDILKKSNKPASNQLGNVSLIATTGLATILAIPLFCHLLPVK